MASFHSIIESAIERGLDDGGFVAGDLAAKLLLEHPVEAHQYLTDHAQAFLAERIRDMTGLRNAGIRAQAKSRAFSRHVESFEAGDLDAFDLAHEMDGSYSRVADWTAVEHLQMAEKYRVSVQELALFEAFHRAVAKKLGKRKTSEAFTAEQYDRMLGRMLRRADVKEQVA